MRKRRFSLSRLSGSFLWLLTVLLLLACAQDFYRGVATWWSVLLTIGLAVGCAFGGYYLLVVNPDQAARLDREDEENGFKPRKRR